MKPLLLVAVLVAGCTKDVDPPWQLDHDRVIAVRATPPSIASGETSVIDALVGHEGQPPVELEPDTAEVVSPTSLAGALSRQGTHWTVTAPSANELAAARTELGLEADALVPLRVRGTFAPDGLSAVKNVWLGSHADNPVIDPITIDGKDAVALAQITVTEGVNVPLAVSLDDTFGVNWLTSCGTMHDFDLPKAYLRVEPTDPHSGSLAVVVRDATGGASWHVWPIATQ